MEQVKKLDKSKNNAALDLLQQRVEIFREARHDNFEVSLIQLISHTVLLR